MTTQVTITRSESGAKGRYLAVVEGREGEGELTYSRISPEKIIADHTGVDESLRGTGVAGELVKRLVDDARKEGFTIVPTCSYIKAQYERHPDWSDVMDG